MTMTENNIRIVHINVFDANGGAAIAAYRLTEAMQSCGIDAQMVVRSKRTDRPYAHRLHLGLRSMLKLAYSIMHKRRLKAMLPTGIFSVMRYGHPFWKDSRVADADVIFLHWVSVNTLSLKGVERILRLGKPTYWFLHDMFPFTGGCHYSFQCEGYATGCEACPLIGSSAYAGFAHRQLEDKIKHWQHYGNLSFVSPSRWLADCAAKSILAKGHPIHIMPNFIDTEVYKPLGESTKLRYGLDVSKHTLLIGAATLDSIYKGAHHTRECLKMLDADRYEALVIGACSADFVDGLPIRVVSTGFISGDRALADAYNACDAFLITSVADNYPNMLLEAMACGKPCIGVACGGIADLIRHCETGFLADSYSPSQLHDAIEKLFADAALYDSMSARSRQRVVETNSYSRAADMLKAINITR